MECNKEIAIKAKSVAEKKLADLDIVGAKKFATIAQNLYPELDGLSQLHTTLNVYVSVQRRTNGEIDWYKVLGVEPSADDDTIRQHYLKLAVALHPDRNQSVGVNGAFKLISRAWSLLSNKAERTVYDEKLNTSSPSGRDVINDGSDSRNWRSVPHCRPPASSRPVKNTFWAMCGACKVQFEYLRTYLNRTLICSNCNLSFLAVEIPAPPLDSDDSFSLRPNMLRTSNDVESTSSSGSKLGTAGYLGTNESGRKSFPSRSLFGPGVDGSVRGSASSDVIGPFRQMKKKHKSAFHSEAYPFEKSIFTYGSAIPEELQLKKARHTTKPMFNGRCRDLGEPMASENVGTTNGSTLDFHKPEFGRVRIGGNNRSIYRGEFTQHEVRNMLVEKAKGEIRKKLKEWKMEEMSRSIEKIPASNNIMSNTDKELDASTGLKSNANKRENADSKNGSIFELSCQNSGENSVSEGSDPFSMIVPDPDFHDFDKDRTEKSFCSNQIWAVYDDDDGMPRYYAMIHNVISLKPFKMRISWLNSKTNAELSPLNWVGCGFPKTSGEFWIGKSEVNGYLNSFSHKISWVKGSRGVVHIYPKKGEVWALYRNWSPEWNQFTPDEIIHKYDMVEVIEDYHEERGVAIVPLVKVVGFRTVFRQHLDPNEKREIARAEMFRFSHQIPSYLLTGIEGGNAPAGCRELDPAATPLELLQEAKETQEMTESAKIKDLQDIEHGDGRNAGEDVATKKETKTEERTTKVYRRKRFRGQEHACGDSKVFVI